MKKNRTRENINYNKIILRSILLSVFILLVSFASLTVCRWIGFKKLSEASKLSIVNKNNLDLLLKNKYSERYQLLQPLPYNVANQKLSVGAEAAILVDVSNGNIIYQKNADLVIPPASMTKLFAMYVVEEEIAKGRFSYDDVIPLPPESWACNMPPHSSLMFLGEGQVVTLEELLLGLSICSGNDAAYALAYTVCGSMEEFVSRMNQVAASLGLSHTHFVESSGYSELNTTTAREMAAFARVYIEKHPQSLQKFHAVQSFTYPKERNLAPGDSLQAQDFSQGLPSHITMSITQKNTNPLLGKLAGCDGLKTGFIEESGYNLALTAKRNGVRFLSVTMRGQGANTQEGQAGRVKDGTELMEYAFRTFCDADISDFVTSSFVKVYGAKEKAVNLLPAFDVKTFSVPFITGNSLQDNLDNLKIEVSKPDFLFGDVVCGYEYGSIKIKLCDGENTFLLDTIPLVADRDVKRAAFIIRLADSICCK